MKQLTQERQAAYTRQMQDRLMPQLRKLDDVECRHVQEVINAIAMGCCLQRPRVFQGTAVSAEFFRKAAQVVSIDVLCVAVDALESAEKKSHVHNRMWYLLGTIVRINPQAPSPHRQRAAMRDGFIQRNYTKDELHSIVTDIDSLDESDI